MAVSEQDFAELVKAVRVIRDNAELNYNAFRNTDELNESREILDRLEKLYPLK